MDEFKLSVKDDPEHRLQEEIKKFLKKRGWHVEVMHGNAFQKGIPDLFICHPRYDMRFVEVKVDPINPSFTKHQKIKFPILAANRVPIYVMTGATEEEYRKLVCNEPNYHLFMRN